jgi:hypothetical protein
MNKLKMNASFCKSCLICFCIFFFSCNHQDIITLRSKKELTIGVGTDLIMNFELVGKITTVARKGNEYIYTAKLTRDIDLRANAHIELGYPLIDNVPNLKVLNRGTNSVATVEDTIDIVVPLEKEKKPADSVSAAKVLRAIADSIDAHMRK